MAPNFLTRRTIALFMLGCWVMLPARLSERCVLPYHICYHTVYMVVCTPSPPPMQTKTQREELMTCPTERAVAANLFFSFGTVDDGGEVTLQPHDLRRMLQSMGVVSVVGASALTPLCFTVGHTVAAP